MVGGGGEVLIWNYAEFLTLYHCCDQIPEGNNLEEEGFLPLWGRRCQYIVIGKG